MPSAKSRRGPCHLAAGDLDNPVWEKVTDPAAEFDPSAYPRNEDHLDIVFKVGASQVNSSSTVISGSSQKSRRRSSRAVPDSGNPSQRIAFG